MAGKIEAICISEKKGTEKKPIQETKIIEDFGLEHDAHAGKWHRQVSLLPYEERENFKRRGGDVEDGAFGENLLISGIDFNKIPFAACNDILPITIAKAPPTNPATSISNFLYSINIIIISGITVSTAINPSGFCTTFSASSANVIPVKNNIENMTFKIKEFFLNIFFLLSGAHSPVN